LESEHPTFDVLQSIAGTGQISKDIRLEAIEKM
jgi:hypothetical protein